MKTKSKPGKPPATIDDGLPKRGKVADTSEGLAATEFRGLAPEEYEAACIFEMIADLSREERRKVTADLQSVVRVVQSAEKQLGREGSNRPSWNRLDRNGKVLVAKRTRGTMVNQSAGIETAVSFITGDQAAFINDQVSHPSQVNGKTPNTSWPLTFATGTTDRQTIALTICWETGLHRIKSDINEWLEKNAPPGTPGGRVSAIVDPSAPTKGKSPFKRAESILRFIEICRRLRSGLKQGDIRPQLASQSSVAHAKGKLIEEYRRILKVNTPLHLAKTR